MVLEFLKRHQRGLRIAVALMVALGLVLAVQDAVVRWRQTPVVGGVGWRWIAVSASMYAIGLLPNSRVLQRLCESISPAKRDLNFKWPDFAAAQLIGHVGKYVPGKALVVVLRAAALSRVGVDPKVASAAVFFETFLMMAVGAVVAGGILVGLATAGLDVARWLTFAAAFVGVAALAVSTPPVLRRVASRLSSVTPDQLRDSVRFGLIGSAWGWSLLGWVFVSLSSVAAVLAMPSFEMPGSTAIAGVRPADRMIIVGLAASAGIMLAMVIGFASLLPGGAGIRELTFTAVLGIAVDPATALLAAIALRGVFLGTEILMAAAAWVFLRSRHYNVVHG